MSKVGVFVFFESDNLPLKDGIYLFDSEAEAEAWQIQALVDAGEIVRVEGGYHWPDESRVLSGEDILSEHQETLGMLEFFYAYPVHEVT